MQRIYERMYEQYRNKKSREAFIQLPMRWGATMHTVIYTFIILYMKKDQFTDTAPYNLVRLIVRKIRYLFSLSRQLEANLVGRVGKEEKEWNSP